MHFALSPFQRVSSTHSMSTPLRSIRSATSLPLPVMVPTFTVATLSLIFLAFFLSSFLSVQMLWFSSYYCVTIWFFCRVVFWLISFVCSLQLCSDLVSASSVSLSSSLVACLVLSRVVIYSFILQTNDFVIFVLYIKLYHSENESRFFTLLPFSPLLSTSSLHPSSISTSDPWCPVTGNGRCFPGPRPIRYEVRFYNAH